MTRRALLAVAFAISVAGFAQAADTKYGDYIFFKPGQLDLGKLRAPAPDPASERHKLDVAAVLEAQKTRTSA